MQKQFRFGIAGICVLIFGVVTALVISACSNIGSIHAKTPSALVGHWHQTSNGIHGTEMSADISSSQIKIELEYSNWEDMYWVGSFDGRRNPKKQFSYLSIGNRSSMDLSLYGSAQQYKNFTYKNGDLSYNFEMLGKKTIVHMSKVETKEKKRKKSPSASPRTNVIKPPKAPSFSKPKAKTPTISKPKTKTGF